jgi:DNA-binding transcriptional ArsR family regulator
VKRPPLAVRAAADAGKLPLRERPLLGQDQADELVRLYKVLANDTRLKLLHAIERAGELSVTDLAAEVGMKPQAVSNQLQRLADRRIVASRRDGSRLFYRIADPCVTGLIDLAMCLLEETGRLPGGEGGG